MIIRKFPGLDGLKEVERQDPAGASGIKEVERQDPPGASGIK